jgi:hypothetical protein
MPAREPQTLREAAGTVAPVFVVGAGGGDAWRLGELLDDHPRLGLAPGSNLLLDLMQAIEKNQDALAHYGLPTQYWRHRAARFFGGLEDEHAASRGKARWIECLSSPPHSINDLERLFPTAQFILVRHHCRWRPAQADRRRFPRRASAQHLEIDSEDLARRPQECLTEVLRFLGEAGPLDETGVLVDLAERESIASPLPHHGAKIQP